MLGPAKGVAGVSSGGKSKPPATAPMGRIGLKRRVASSASAGDDGAEKLLEMRPIDSMARRQVKLENDSDC